MNENGVLDICSESGGHNVLEKFKEPDSFQKLPVRSAGCVVLIWLILQGQKKSAKPKTKTYVIATPLFFDASPTFFSI